MYNRIIKLTTKEIRSLKKQFQSFHFNNDFDLVYEAHVPNTGIILLDGELKLLKKKKVSSTVKPGSLLGVYEMMNNEPVKNGCKVIGNSELIMLQKSDILEAMEDKESDLYAIIKESLNEKC
jgi:CRP-like cAMP-binding protein